MGYLCARALHSAVRYMYLVDVRAMECALGILILAVLCPVA